MKLKQELPQTGFRVTGLASPFSPVLGCCLPQASAGVFLQNDPASPGWSDVLGLEECAKVTGGNHREVRPAAALAPGERGLGAFWWLRVLL